MNRRRSEDRLYTVLMVAFLLSLVALGLLGVPALLVAAIGALVAALGIAVFHRVLEGHRPASHSSGVRGKVPATYVPRVLESGSMRRRRRTVLRRNRRTSPPLRFR